LLQDLNVYEIQTGGSGTKNHNW